MLKILNTGISGDTFMTAHPYDMAAKSTDILPYDCPIMTNIFVVDKMDVVVCDGDDKWYSSVDGVVTSANAGQPISALF